VKENQHSLSRCLHVHRKHILLTDRGLQAEDTEEAYYATEVNNKLTVAEYSDVAYGVDQ